MRFYTFVFILLEEFSSMIYNTLLCSQIYFFPFNCIEFFDVSPVVYNAFDILCLIESVIIYQIINYIFFNMTSQIKAP